MLVLLCEHCMYINCDFTADLPPIEDKEPTLKLTRMGMFCNLHTQMNELCSSPVLCCFSQKDNPASFEIAFSVITVGTNYTS